MTGTGQRAAVLLAVLSMLGAGCAHLPWREAPRVRVVGMEPLPGEGMELRFRLQLRVQNPGSSPIDYDGIALDLDLNGRSFASGVSNASGSIAGFSEAVIAVPVTVSGFAVLRQLFGLMEAESIEAFPYELRGRLGGGLFPARFRDEGRLEIPEHPAARSGT